MLQANPGKNRGMLTYKEDVSLTEVAAINTDR